MTLTDRLTEVRERLLLSGDYGPGWSATCDATVCQEALERIEALEAALREGVEAVAHAERGSTHWEGCEKSHVACAWVKKVERLTAERNSEPK